MSRKGNSKINRRIVFTAFATCICALALVCKTPGQGSIEVAPRENVISEYKAYHIASGNYDEGTLWDIELIGKFAGNFWNELGFEGSLNPLSVMDWFTEKVENDFSGEFLDRVVQLVHEQEIQPDYVFTSNEKQNVQDGYYLVESQDCMPMLILTGGDETITIYEKSIYANPETGDGNEIWFFAVLGTLALITIMAILTSFWKNKDNDERKRKFKY